MLLQSGFGFCNAILRSNHFIAIRISIGILALALSLTSSSPLEQIDHIQLHLVGLNSLELFLTIRVHTRADHRPVPLAFIRAEFVKTMVLWRQTNLFTRHYKL